MIPFLNRYISIMVLYACTLHFGWVTALLLDPMSADESTAVHSIGRYVYQLTLFTGWSYEISLILTIGGSAWLASVALLAKNPWVVFLLIPQQLLLVASASGAVEAIWLSQFADGVIRPRAFIFTDQFNSISAAFWHTMAIILHSVRISRYERRY